MPTLRPWFLRENAKLTAVVDLPTPPLHEATATTRLTPASPPRLASRTGAASAAAGSPPAPPLSSDEDEDDDDDDDVSCASGWPSGAVTTTRGFFTHSILRTASSQRCCTSFFVDRDTDTGNSTRMEAMPRLGSAMASATHPPPTRSPAPPSASSPDTSTPRRDVTSSGLRLGASSPAPAPTSLQRGRRSPLPLSVPRETAGASGGSWRPAGRGSGEWREEGWRWRR
mmetsp:Transcript_19078/g.36961  ORF Transcript_19078/g.36961 Transcript_19078/m.36961 type:complete len:227 (-) Transcript_19078:130-810(-)